MLLAFLAGTTVVWGQAQHNSNPRPMTCTTGPLNPVAGVPYDYSATLNPTGGSAYWFATTTINFITGSTLTAIQEAPGGNFVMPAPINYQIGALGATSPSTTTITWNSIGLSQVTPANPLFVVVNYTADPLTGCNNNLKVFRIEPVNAFMVNVLNLGGSYSAPVSSCYDTVFAASYDLTNSCMIYDYGTDTLKYEIVAANFTTSYTPSFRVDGIQAGTSVDVAWNYVPNSTTATVLGTLVVDGIIAGTPVTTTLPNTSTGVSIYVFLIVHNQVHEGITNDPVTLAAAGLNLASEPNVRWDDCLIDVDLTAPLAAANGPDYGIHTLNARPELNENMPGGETFEPACP